MQIKSYHNTFLVFQISSLHTNYNHCLILSDNVWRFPQESSSSCLLMRSFRSFRAYYIIPSICRCYILDTLSAVWGEYFRICFYTIRNECKNKVNHFRNIPFWVRTLSYWATCVVRIWKYYTGKRPSTRGTFCETFFLSHQLRRYNTEPTVCDTSRVTTYREWILYSIFSRGGSVNLTTFTQTCKIYYNLQLSLIILKAHHCCPRWHQPFPRPLLASGLHNIMSAGACSGWMCELLQPTYWLYWPPLYTYTRTKPAYLNKLFNLYQCF